MTNNRPMTNNLAAIELMFDGCRGVYIPQAFAEMDQDCLTRWGFEPGDEDIEYLKAGPDQEHYGDTWNDVMNRAKYESTGHVLYQDGDLWAINEAQMTNDERRNFGFDLRGNTCLGCAVEMEVNTDTCTYICGQYTDTQNICGQQCWDKVSLDFDSNAGMFLCPDVIVDKRLDEFSVTACDNCGSTLGGERWLVISTLHNGADYAEMSNTVCFDCKAIIDEVEY